MFQVPEKNRINSGPLASWPVHGNNGAFHIQLTFKSQTLTIWIAWLKLILKEHFFTVTLRTQKKHVPQ
jgi:hypothetical protein